MVNEASSRRADRLAAQDRAGREPPPAAAGRGGPLVGRHAVQDPVTADRGGRADGPLRLGSAVRWLRERLGIIAGVVLFALALIALQHLLKDFHYREVMQHLRDLRWSVLLAALGLTACSYVSLIGYDLSALRYVGVSVPLRRVALASFTGYAISNNIGFAALTGGSIRYRIYSASGVGAGDIARIVVFCTLTFGGGVCAVGAGGLLSSPETATRLIGLPVGLVEVVALALVLAPLVAIALSFAVRHPIHLWRWTIALPSPGILGAQVIISSIDILLSGGVLFVVLAGDTSLTFPAFIVIYAAALLAGIASHVPGGMGVFESLMILGLSDRVPGDAVFAALVAYRAIYYLLPMMVAGALLAVNELHRQRHQAARALRWLGGWTPDLAPPLMAAMTFAGGVIMLFSGATPSIHWRLRLLAQLMPLEMLEVSHILGSLVGLGLLLAARGLYRRLDAAWALSVGLMALGVIVSLGKGLAYEEAALLAVMAAILGPCRREFYRHATLRDLNFSPGWLFAISGAVLGTIWLTQFSLRHGEYAGSLWWEFAVKADAPRSLRAALVVGVAIVAVSLIHLLRPARARPHLPTDDEVDRARSILRASPRAEGSIALLRDKAFLFNDAGTAFVMYGRHGRSWIAEGDPVGPASEQAELIWRFRELCDRSGVHPAFYQVGPDSLPLYLDVGLTPLKLGEDARLPLPGFSLDDPARAELAQTMHRAEAEGLSFAVLERAEVPAHLDALQAISDAWLAQHRAVERGFAIGRFDRDYLAELEIAVVRRAGRAIGFAPVWQGAAGGDASVDFVRFEPSAPPFTMDYLFVRLIQWAEAAGFRDFSLGMAPLAGPEAHRLAPLWQRFGAFVFPHGEHFYSFRGLRQHKEKFRPSWEARYLACLGGLPPDEALSDAASLISAGPRPAELV